METKKLLDFTTYVKNYAIDGIDNLNGEQVDMGYLADNLISCDMANGCVEPSVEKCKDLIREWWYDCDDLFEYQKENFDMNVNPFRHPCVYILDMVHYGLRNLLQDLQIYNDYKGKGIMTINDNFVKVFTEQVEEISEILIQ